MSNSPASVGIVSLSPNSAVDQLSGSGEIGVAVVGANSTFTLERGNVLLYSLCLQAYPDFPFGLALTNGLATFVQQNGSLTLGSLRFGTPTRNSSHQGEFVLQAGTFTASQLQFFKGRFTQTGGANTAETLTMPAWKDNCLAEYVLSGGALSSGSISLGLANWLEQPSPGRFSQSGGVHTNGSMSLSGQFIEAHHLGTVGVNHFGSYSQSGGLFVSRNVSVDGGAFSQSGGTSRIQELTVTEAGAFTLTGGRLFTSNTTLRTSFCMPDANSRRCYTAGFIHDTGAHTVKNTLQLGTLAQYQLRNGKLSTRNIIVGPNSELNCENGSVTNSGMFTIRGGIFRAGNQSHQLGELKVVEVTSWVAVPPQNAVSLDVAGPRGTILRFRDSRQVAWTGTVLRIFGWQPWTRDGGGGSHHVFFGTNSQGLTAAQINKLVFVNPGGWPLGNYPARLLRTGELVPAQPPSLALARRADGLTLSWSGDYDLLIATNVMGPYFKIPGATSPVTHPFTAPQEYFRLSLPSR